MLQPKPDPTTVYNEALARYLKASGISQSPYAQSPALTQAKQAMGPSLGFDPKLGLAGWKLGEKLGIGGGTSPFAGAEAGAELLSPTTGAAGAFQGATAGAEAGLSNSALSGASTLSSVAPYLGAAGLVGGGVGLYQGLKNHDPKTSALGGAAMGLGGAAALPLLGFGPVGWGALGLSALIGGGAGGLLGALSGMGDKDMWKTEGKRINALRDQGYALPAPTLTHGQSKEDLIARALASGGNVDFARTRDESKLKGADTQGYAINYELFGKDYANADMAKKIAANQMILDSGGYREHHGSVDKSSSFTPELESKVKAFLAGSANGRK